MLDTSLLSPLAKQMMSADKVEAGGRRLRVRRTSRQGRELPSRKGVSVDIEEDPEKPTHGEGFSPTRRGFSPLAVLCASALNLRPS